MSDVLISPYGGRLVALLLEGDVRRSEFERAKRLPSISLSSWSLCDFEMLATGALSPLDGFMGEADYRSVLADMRLSNGLLFPIPITLPVARSAALEPGAEVCLRTPANDIVAVLGVREIFERDPQAEALAVCGSLDPAHPMVREILGWDRWCVSGALRAVALPKHYDFPDLRRTPGQVRQILSGFGCASVVAFQTRNPLHRAHEWLMKRAVEETGGALLVHPAVGRTKPGDVDHYTRVRSYKAVVERYFDPRRTLLSLCPLAMRMAGPREAAWHAIIRRNYGASHFIVGRDHASPGKNSAGRPFYTQGQYDALVDRMEEEIGVKPIRGGEVVYLPDEQRYELEDRVPPSSRVFLCSGTQGRSDLSDGRPLPEWYTRPETAAILASASPPRHLQGFCVWFTGLSAAGKSTLAETVTGRLLENGRQVTLLDGDVVRTHLSKGLGFSREDRDTNVLRLAFVASEIVRHHGIAIVAAVSPFRAARQEARSLVGKDRFLLAYVKTPLSVCVERDTKGLYERAARGELNGVSGLDDPYEEPVQPDLVLDTVLHTPEALAEQVLLCLREKGMLRPGVSGNGGAAP
ncbi:MAG: bifunctional sulfate adenylyltransferase/adenylylsulfate kinase [Thermoanaerobaculia bacterium]